MIRIEREVIYVKKKKVSIDFEQQQYQLMIEAAKKVANQIVV